MSGNGAKIIALDLERMQAMVDKDVAKLNDMLCDSLIYTHSSARLDTKQSLIDGMVSGTTVYRAVVPSDVVAQDLGDAVVLTGVAEISVEANGAPLQFAARFMDVYQNQDGTWRMVAWQSTKLPD